MTSPRGMRCLCVALDVLTLSCCYQRVREEPDVGRDQLQRSHQRLQRDRRDCSHQRQNPRAASAPSNCAGCGPCPRARQGGTCTRAQDDPWRSDTWRSVAQRSDTSSASGRSDSWRSGTCNNSRRTSRQACFGQRRHTTAPVSSHQTAQQIKPNHPSEQTTAAVQSSWVLLSLAFSDPEKFAIALENLTVTLPGCGGNNARPWARRLWQWISAPRQGTWLAAAPSWSACLPSSSGSTESAPQVTNSA